jgi:NitT/TauT family transport system permease protein/sulfonate transport system permease protein
MDINLENKLGPVLTRRSIHLASYVCVLLAWDLPCRFGLLKTSLLPPPLEVLKAFVQLSMSGQMVLDALTSLWRVLIGFAIATILGIGLGLSTAISPRLRQFASPIFEMLRPIPPVAWTPIAIAWFGLGNGPAFFIVALGAFFPIFTNALAGVLSVSPIDRDAALCLGAGRRLMLTDVLIPGALPYLVVGLRTGLGTAWFCVIVAELVGAQSGLGYAIQLNRLTLQSDKVLAGMIAIGLLGYLMHRLMTCLQRRVVPWRVESLRREYA